MDISPQISHSASTQPLDDADLLSYRVHRRRSILSDSSNNLNYSYRNQSTSSLQLRYNSLHQQRRPSSFDNGNFDYSYTNHHNHLDNNHNTAYVKLKKFTERLLEIERKAREKRWNNNQTTIGNNENSQKQSTTNNRKNENEHIEKINKQYGLCVQDVVNRLNRRRNSKSITCTVVNEVQMDTTTTIPTTIDNNINNQNILTRFINEKRKRSLNSDELNATKVTQNHLFTQSLPNGDPDLNNFVTETPSFYNDTDVRKAKIRRIQSDSVLAKFSRRSPRQNLRKVKTMPAMMIINYPTIKLNQQSNTPPLVTELRDNTINETLLPITQQIVPTASGSPSIEEDTQQSSSIKREKQVVFEVKSNTYKRKVEVKTKQEDKILKKPAASISGAVIQPPDSCVPESPSILMCTHEHRRASFSNSSLQSFKVSISSSDSSTKLPTATDVTDDSTSDIYTSMLGSLREDSYNDFTTAVDTSSHLDDFDLRRDEEFDKRPLLELISELHKHHIPQKMISVEKGPQEQLKSSQESLLLSPTEYQTAISPAASSSSARPLSPTIVPPKQFSPFRPVIVHRKYQSPIGRFEFVDGNENIAGGGGNVRRNSRTGGPVIRSHTFNSNHVVPVKDLSVESVDSTQTTDDTDRMHHISTPELFTALPTISGQELISQEHERTAEDKNEVGF
ncbi:unnamed protein product [Didymodactylos carnosus]|uniref:Uncharacterized protein n=1 Tax=Didymodactylos carnosus TaxID=1234261 RepID=A0A8S2JNW0_9BILA|nr:unnamed protein product [Didymodactylos carnosus]CAF3816498.1 unnamed protein product [Didymodactylos carnosus]